MIRITQNQVTSRYQNDLSAVYEQLARTQRQASTGLRIETPSDDPFGTSQVLGFDAQLSDIRQYQRNVDDTIGFLNTADAALDAAGGAIKRIRDLVVQASNGTYDQQALNAMAAEIRQLKEAVRDSANARYGSTYVFSGTATSTQPFPAPANAYAGNAGIMSRRVSPSLQTQFNVPGTTVFGTTTGAAPSQLSTLDLIDQIVTDMTTGTPASLQQLRSLDLDALDQRHAQILQERSNLGAVEARMEVTKQQLADLDERITGARSSVSDADMAKTYMQLQSQQTMYQSALAAGTRIMQTSILDFI